MVVGVRQSDSRNFEVKDQGVFKKKTFTDADISSVAGLMDIWPLFVHFLLGYRCPDTW